jgi:Ca2+-binding EF-hand superfamily protein
MSSSRRSQRSDRVCAQVPSTSGRSQGSSSGPAGIVGVCKDTHARIEQQRLLDDLEVKRMAVFNPSERDQKLRALFHTFDLDGNGMVDKEEFFTIGKAIYGEHNWTHELNDAGFALVDKDDSGEIDEDEFVFIFTSNMNNMRDQLFDKMVNTYAERATIAGEYVIRDRENVRCRS